MTIDIEKLKSALAENSWVRRVEETGIIEDAARSYLATKTVTDDARKQALDEFPGGAWHLNEWNDWIAKHCETIRAALMKGDKWNFNMDEAPKGTKYENRIIISYNKTRQEAYECTDEQDDRRWWYGSIDGAIPIDEIEAWTYLPTPPNNSSNDSKAVDGKERGE